MISVSFPVDSNLSNRLSFHRTIGGNHFSLFCLRIRSFWCAKIAWDPSSSVFVIRQLLRFLWCSHSMCDHSVWASRAHNSNSCNSFHDNVDGYFPSEPYCSPLPLATVWPTPIVVVVATHSAHPVYGDSRWVCWQRRSSISKCRPDLLLSSGRDPSCQSASVSPWIRLDVGSSVTLTLAPQPPSSSPVRNDSAFLFAIPFRWNSLQNFHINREFAFVVSKCCLLVMFRFPNDSLTRLTKSIYSLRLRFYFDTNRFSNIFISHTKLMNRSASVNSPNICIRAVEDGRGYTVHALKEINQLSIELFNNFLHFISHSTNHTQSAHTHHDEKSTRADRTDVPQKSNSTKNRK